MPKTPSRLRKQAEQVYLLTDQLQVQLQALERSRVPVPVTFRPFALGTGSDDDIMAMAFIVLMEAARSAREDLKAIMEQVKAANAAKKELCRLFKKKKGKTHHVRPGALDFDSVFCLMATLYAKHLDEEADELLDSLDSLSEKGEMESLRLQMAMDRLSKLMSTLSNLLKKISDTSSQITQNMK
jgi:hypothetical protein